MSAGAKKRNKLDINNTNTVNAALSNNIDVHTTLTVVWEQLYMAGRYWVTGTHKTHYQRTSHSEC